MARIWGASEKSNSSRVLVLGSRASLCVVRWCCARALPTQPPATPPGIADRGHYSKRHKSYASGRMRAATRDPSPMRCRTSRVPDGNARIRVSGSFSPGYRFRTFHELPTSHSAVWRKSGVPMISRDWAIRSMSTLRNERAALAAAYSRMARFCMGSVC